MNCGGFFVCVFASFFFVQLAKRKEQTKEVLKTGGVGRNGGKAYKKTPNSDAGICSFSEC